MQKQRKTGYADVEYRVARVRETYSRIGEPLPVDVIIDLHRHLGAALELAREDATLPLRRQPKTCRKAN